MLVALKSTSPFAAILVLMTSLTSTPVLGQQSSEVLASLDISPERARMTVDRLDAVVASSSSQFEGRYVTGASSIRVHRVGAKVLLVAHGQAAMDALLDAGEQAPLHAQLNDFTRDVLLNLGAGQTTALSDRLALSRHDVALSDIGGLFGLFAREYGSMTDFEIMGTRLTGSGKQSTFARVSFEGGTEDIHFVWEGRALNTVQRHPAPAVVLVAVPVGADQLAVIDPGAEQPRLIYFVRGSGEGFKYMEISGRTRDYRAHRVQ